MLQSKKHFYDYIVWTLNILKQFKRILLFKCLTNKKYFGSLKHWLTPVVINNKGS